VKVNLTDRVKSLASWSNLSYRTSQLTYGLVTLTTCPLSLFWCLSLPLWCLSLSLSLSLSLFIANLRPCLSHLHSLTSHQSGQTSQTSRRWNRPDQSYRGFITCTPNIIPYIKPDMCFLLTHTSFPPVRITTATSPPWWERVNFLLSNLVALVSLSPPRPTRLLHAPLETNTTTCVR